MVTIKQIAEMAGVHRSTVDKVLHNRPGVSPEVRAKIQKIIDELNYHPNPLGQALKKKQENIRLGILLRKVDACEFILSGIRRAQRDYAGYDLDIWCEILPPSGVQEQQMMMNRMIDDGVNGIILTPIDTPGIRSAIERASKEGIPVITINNDVPNSERLCYVGQNGHQAGRTAGCMMGEILNGNGNVVVITDQLALNGRDYINYLREKGFRRVLKKDYPEIKILEVFESFEDTEKIFLELTKILEGTQPVHGIYITCGGVSEVGKVLRQKKLEQKIKVICFERYPEIRKLMQERIVNCSLDSELDLQGYTPIHLMMDRLLYGKTVEDKNQYTKTRILLRENLPEEDEL